MMCDILIIDALLIILENNEDNKYNSDTHSFSNLFLQWICGLSARFSWNNSYKTDTVIIAEVDYSEN